MTENDWDEATSVSEIRAAPDTIPAPPPTEPEHEQPEPSLPRPPVNGEPFCLICGMRLIWDTAIRYYVCDNPACERCE